MNIKTMLISAIFAAVVFIGTALYLAGRSPDQTEEIAIPVPKPTARVARPETKVVEPEEESTDTTIMDSTEESEPEISFSGQNSLGIDEAELADIRRMVASMSEEIDSNNSVEQEAYYYRDSETDQTPEALALRLALDPEAAEALNELLSTYNATQLEQMMTAQKKYAENVKNMLKTDPEGYANYLALLYMRSPDHQLTEEQEAYFLKYQQMIDVSDDSTTKTWYDDLDIMTKLNERLSPEQQTELNNYVQEKKNRQREIDAYMRSFDLAETLGLNDADRTALYEYIYNNPDASNEDVSELLTPELKELLTPKQ
jgi:hypothetical protein